MSGSAALTMILALVFVLALMGILLFIIKRLGLGGAGIPAPGATRRLRIVEVLPLSPQHRAVLMKQDDTEHLVILGPNGATVVDSPIKREGT